MLTDRERQELRTRVESWFDLPLLLGAVTLVLLLLVEATESLAPPWDTYVAWIELGIWILFAVEFALRLWLSADRWAYVKAHWLDAVAVLVPALRVFRVLRAVRGIRALRALRILAFGGRGASELLERLRRRRLGRLAVTTAFVVLIGSALLYLAEADQPGSPVASFGDALYWGTMVVVGTEGGLEVTTTWGRVVTLVLVLYSLVVFSYVIGAVASLWVEQDRAEREAGSAGARGEEG